MDASLCDTVAGWLAEALETGNPLAPLPAAAMPPSLRDGQRIAAQVLEALGLVPCGFRLTPGPAGAMVPGPVLEGRLLPDGASIALAALRHPAVAPAVLGVLAKDLAPEEEAPPVFASLHPALDIAAWRLRDQPLSAPLAAADLGGHGLLVAGRGKRLEPVPLRVGFGPATLRRRGVETDIPAALGKAAEVAREAGGLPSGAVLVAVLAPALTPEAGLEISASFGALGRVRARFA
ncbi:hypothetical protein [Siccirubricoccus sp. G192]|uniref:hypothetical protein n=1 Tax=Siccirubricoccus sp. G192 TaxID=2849651 RepID=UPI001C2C86AA|nr:hypothetical protein [Siccirubricoccus sp. G192]MBV1798063.1 hypothetical protein [Siccirubricoccus sp. G192]